MIPKITAADIINYCYCPRIVYFTRVIKLPQTKTSKQLKGLEKDFNFQRDTKRNRLLKKDNFKISLIKKYGVSLETDEFATKVDCLFIDENLKEAYPLQLKYSKKPAGGFYKTTKMQLLFEAFLIENKLNYKVPYGYIKYSLSGDVVKVNLENRKELFDIIEKIKKIIKEEIYPSPTKYKSRIIDNCYRNFY